MKLSAQLSDPERALSRPFLTAVNAGCSVKYFNDKYL
jgi:hypothetical protein